MLDLENIDGRIEIAPGLKIGYLSQDLFWSDDKNTLREEMNTIFPGLRENINRLSEIKDDPESWEEIENLNSEIISIDGFKKDALKQEVLRYF